MAQKAIPGGRDRETEVIALDEKSPFEICRDCEYRHTYCHASCEVYHDIIREKQGRKKPEGHRRKIRKQKAF